MKNSITVERLKELVQEYITLRNDEMAIYSLRELYRKYGYTQYKVGKFEEYAKMYKSTNNLIRKEGKLQ